MFKGLLDFFRGRKAGGDGRDELLREAMEYIQELDLGTVSPCEDAFAVDVKGPDGKLVHRVFLDNLYAETRECSPEEKKSRMAFHFASLGDTGEESWEEARAALVPVVRATTFAIELRAMSPDAVNIRRPFLPFLDLLVAVDTPTAMKYVTRGTLETWEIGEQELFDALGPALDRFARAEVELHDDVHGPLFIVATKDTYETSRLAVPGFLASFRGKVEGNPVAILPERATLLIGGDARPAMIERLLDKAEREFTASNRSISPAIYTVDDEDKVVPYLRGGNDELANKVKTAHEKLAIFEYGTQKTALKEIHEKDGTDVFVATYRVFEAPEGSVRSVGIWTEGVATYLPKTEKVFLLRLPEVEGAEPTLRLEVPFAAVEALLSPVPGTTPPLFATGEFPEDAAIEALKAAHG